MKVTRGRQIKRHWLRRAATALAVAALAGHAGAAAIGTGLFGKAPHILGTVRKGEADEVKRDFVEGLKAPLMVNIDPRSDPVELMRIGQWLYERKPVIKLRGSCVGACAKSILLSAGSLSIEPGTVIAFGGMAEFPASMKEQVEGGELFIEDDERSRASRERFLKTLQPVIGSALEQRALLEHQAPMPAGVKAFVKGLTGSWHIKSLSFAGEEANMAFASLKHPCLWWVPDAQGLRQLGLDVPAYRPVSRAEAAKLLKLPEQYIYVGPSLDVLPEQPLCEGVAQGFQFAVLP